ncbi:hypothetical protein CHU92_14000 [Flavobacterium cyanobacteriorum]|uniref:Glycosyltransferase 2-like domain-containing protein n=1 Tax=Flavobacterium cyanobacteriorum TaxID=2022802 RepID=A0A255YUY9_9FLAO|nr:glycosyltransferase [Flavobacterium cyanobacteriorum]OYQ33028.1 hypothetical protein CHU92_14000 [Flavobacterium cyanobacteriorum]
MLSVLIPTYNFNVYPLAAAIQKQCAGSNIAFEIIVIDDGSGSALNAENDKINYLHRCSFSALSANIGRSAIRNLLASKANYTWMLFLDADTLPVDENLIKNYLPHMDNHVKVVYGGIKYKENKPETMQLLRWVYGNRREALEAEERQQRPYLRLLTLNFLAHKDVFEKVRFNENIPNVRHEDTLFSYDLMVAGLPVEHIDNNVYHLGLDNSIQFIRKSEEAIAGLKFLLQEGLLPDDYVGMGRLYARLRKAGLAATVSFIFVATRKAMLKNLLGSHPSLKLFDFYRIGYMCSLPASQ